MIFGVRKFYELHVDERTRPNYIPAQNPEYHRTLPDDTSPAVLNNLFRRSFFSSQFKGKMAGRAFTATMLDLFAEDILIMRKTGRGDIEISVNSEKASEQDYERTVVSLIDAVAGKNPQYDSSAAPMFVTLKNIQKYINANKEFAKNIKDRFEKEVEAKANESPYLEEFTRNRPEHGWFYIRMAAIAACFGALISIIVNALFMGSGITVFITASVIALVVFGIMALRCSRIGGSGFSASQLGANQAALWAGFGKFLDDFTSFKEKEFPEFKLWGRYLVYATALGKSKKLIKELALYYPVENINTTDPWYMQHTVLAESIAAGTLFDTIDKIQSSAYAGVNSSGDGGGGGFSSSGGGSDGGSAGSSSD